LPVQNVHEALRGRMVSGLESVQASILC